MTDILRLVSEVGRRTLPTLSQLSENGQTKPCLKTLHLSDGSLYTADKWERVPFTTSPCRHTTKLNVFFQILTVFGLIYLPTLNVR